MKRNLAQQLSLVALGLLAFTAAAQAQSRAQIEAPWRIGLNAGLNYNFGAFGYQKLEPSGGANFAPFVANDGTGIGPYIGLMAEYNSKGWWGAQLRASFDVRNAKVTDPTFGYDKTFDTRSSYVTIEPMLRLNLVSKSPFYMTFGPLFGINMSGDYDFTDPNPTGQPVAATQDITDINSLTVGFGGGFSYDFVLNDRMADLRWYLAPWIESSWMLHQRGITIIDLDQDKFDDIWSTPNVRAGIALKMGIMPPLNKVAMEDGSGIINLALATPAGGYIRQRQFEEFFPVINSVFFDSTSSDIPGRYAQISSSDIATFNENNLMDSTKAGKIDLNQRRAVQMNVYHNVMNIIGTRMKADPSTSIKLSGAAGPYGAKDGTTLATNVKNYLVNTVGIDAGRISIEDRELPVTPSGSARTPAEDRPLVNAENRRVDLFTAPSPLNAPVRITSLEESSIENDLVLNVDEGKIASWQVVITGEGKELTYGPFDHANQRIDSREMMGTLKNGKYTAEVIATTTDGQVIRQTKDFELVRKDGLSKPARRFTIVFPYGSDDPVRLYDNFLKTVVAPRIDDGSTVYVIGTTDAVGNADINYRLSKSRAGEVRDMLKGETGKSGKTVTYEVVGYGEEESQLSYDNMLPEGRQYNRGVTIEVIPND